MPELRKIGDLQIDEDFSLQQRFWRLQRIGWVVMALVCLLGLLGLLGPGPLNEVQAASAEGGLRIIGPRLARHHTDFVLRLEVTPDDERTEVPLRLDGRLLEQARVQSIAPAPLRSEAGEAGVTLHFARAADARALHITLHLTAQTVGRLEAHVSSPGLGTARWRGLVLP